VATISCDMNRIRGSVPDTELDMRLVNTIVRYESSARPWRRLLEIATDYFPDTLADLAFLRARGMKLELQVNQGRTAYFANLVGPDVDTVEAARQAGGRTPLAQPLAALAADSRDHEAAEGRKLARHVATGSLTFRYARSLCEGFGFESFDVELARYRAEISEAKAVAKKRAK
jgi:hypothetical protein